MLLRRDPVLYLARFVASFAMVLMFSIIHLEARDLDQETVVIRMWSQGWAVGNPQVVAMIVPYVLFQEKQMVAKEVKLGMYAPISYCIAITLVQLPMMFVWAFCSLLPGYV